MFGFKPGSGAAAKGVLEALGKSLAIIEFDPKGTILTANANFCQTLGYDLGEIQGKHHSLFVTPAEVQSTDYRDFWARLGRGEFDARQYKRIAKGGREVWIQASYNPVLSESGAVTRVVKVATDITVDKLRNAEFEGMLDAISRVQAVIEFTVNGEIITANDNFLTLLGYRLSEVQGQHHRMFVDSSHAQSSAYKDFWQKLKRGEYVSASFKRIAKHGKEVWIQASYNPIFDMNGTVVKVVKFASDISDLTEIGGGLSRMADNNLEQRIEKAFSPTFEKLRGDFNMAHDSLKTALLEVADGTDAIHKGASQISSSADELSRRTEQQAANLEQTAAALDEITSTVQKSAEGASHAREVVKAADADAKTSAIVVREAVEAMDAISKSSRQISQIIGVIDEIAFQTNLLALNAGVEAARAGDAGRGFAVVASEVRALAQRSAEAAKEIKGLIYTSTTQVEHGVKLVGETGRSLERIIVQVADINGVMETIAAGTREQSTALGEVNTAINQMDEVTQRNAAMVEETNAASHALSQEAERLSGLIERFAVGRTEAPQASVPALPRGPQVATGGARLRSPAPSRLAKPTRTSFKPKIVSRTAHDRDADDWQEF